MKIIHIANIIFIIFVLGCSNMSVKPNSRIAENLLLVIHPVTEDKNDYIRTVKICNCVAESIKANWEAERVNKFDVALNSYSQEMIMEIQNIKKPLDLNQFQLSKPDEYLRSELNAIAKYVTGCEERFGGRVEF
jgi:hypothetical protein